ncbi:hypothetical protein [Pseudomonas sp. CLCA07]
MPEEKQPSQIAATFHRLFLVASSPSRQAEKGVFPTNTGFKGRMVGGRQARGIAGNLQPLQAFQKGTFVALK